MSDSLSFVDSGDHAEVGDEVVFHGDHDNLVRAIVTDRALSPLSGLTNYRVVDFWSEAADPDAGKWITHTRLFTFRIPRNSGETP
jgi:hypothetical protein